MLIDSLYTIEMKKQILHNSQHCKFESGSDRPLNVLGPRDSSALFQLSTGQLGP